LFFEGKNKSRKIKSVPSGAKFVPMGDIIENEGIIFESAMRSSGFQALAYASNRRATPFFDILVGLHLKKTIFAQLSLRPLRTIKPKKPLKKT